MQSTYQAQPLSKQQLKTLRPIKQYFNKHPRLRGASITGAKLGNWVLTSTTKGDTLFVLMQLPPSSIAAERYCIYHYVKGDIQSVTLSPLHIVHRCIHTAQAAYNQLVQTS